MEFNSYSDEPQHTGLLTPPCRSFTLRSHAGHPSEGEGHLYTLGLLEQLRAECGELWGTSSKLYHRVDKLLRQLADPDLPDIPARLPCRGELWDRSNQLPAGSSQYRRALRSGMRLSKRRFANYPAQRFTLPNGILVIREHVPET